MADFDYSRTKCDISHVTSCDAGSHRIVGARFFFFCEDEPENPKNGNEDEAEEPAEAHATTKSIMGKTDDVDGEEGGVA